MQPVSSTATRQSPLPALMQRTPQRISITISWQLHQRLLQRSDAEGRSLSNLAAFLLEKSSGQLQ
jgi:hypothetical protein